MVSLLTIGIAGLPFTYAMTLNIGVPIKLYEVVLPAIVFLVLGHVCLSGRLPFCMRKDDRSVVAILGLFCVLYTVSYLVGLPKLAGQFSRLPDPEWFSGRHNPYFASSLRVVQVVANAVLFVVTLVYGRERLILFIKAWLLGACLSGSYSWYSIASFLSGHEPILLPGMTGHLSESLIIGVLGRPVPRSGTFLEGSFGGPYMLLSAVLAFSLYSVHRRWCVLCVAWFLWASVFATFSTIPIVCALAVGVVVAAMKLRGVKPIEKRMLLGYVAGVALVIGSTQVDSIPIIKEAVVYKVFGAPDAISLSQISVNERKDFIRAGLNIALEAPALGVGPSNYGLFFEKYSEMPGLGLGGKRIANNVYVEVLAESGIAGLIAFLSFVYLIVRRCLWRARREKMQKLIGLGLVSLLLMFNAFPTFAMAYVWVYFAFAYLLPLGAEGAGSRLHAGVIV